MGSQETTRRKLFVQHFIWGKKVTIYEFVSNFKHQIRRERATRVSYFYFISIPIIILIISNFSTQLNFPQLRRSSLLSFGQKWILISTQKSRKTGRWKRRRNAAKRKFSSGKFGCLGYYRGTASLFFATLRKIYVSAGASKLCGRWNGRAEKLNEWFSSRGAPLNNLPVALPFPPPLLSASVIRERSHDRYERNFLALFTFFLDPSILYRKLSEFSERGGLVYIRIIEYSANKTRAEWIERFEYSSINFTVTGFTSHTARQSIIPPRDYKSFLELSRFFPATFVQRRRRRKKIKSIRKNVESSILVVYL